MKKLIVYGAGSQWGAGSEILKVSRVINKANAIVTAYFDEEDQVGMNAMLFDHARVLHNINEIQTIQHDYIVIASYEYDRITRKLEKIGVPERKIVQFFNYHFYLMEDFFFKERHVTDQEISCLFTGIAAARMALKY